MYVVCCWFFNSFLNRILSLKACVEMCLELTWADDRKCIFSTHVQGLSSIHILIVYYDYFCAHSKRKGFWIDGKSYFSPNPHSVLEAVVLKEISWVKVAIQLARQYKFTFRYPFYSSALLLRNTRAEIKSKGLHLPVLNGSYKFIFLSYPDRELPVSLSTTLCFPSTVLITLEIGVSKQHFTTP